MSLAEIIALVTLVATVIAAGATAVQAWVAWRTYRKNHPVQRHHYSKITSWRLLLYSPWAFLISLIALLLINPILGFLSAPSALASALAFAWVLVWVLGCSIDSRLTAFLGLGLLLCWFLSLFWVWVSASASWYPAIMPLFFAGLVAFSLALSELSDKDFNKFHIFLIMLGTYWLGLGLGWLAYQIFPIFR